VYFFSKFWVDYLTTDYVIMRSTQNSKDEQIMLTCYFLFILFHAIKQKNDKILCVIEQRPRD